MADLQPILDRFRGEHGLRLLADALLRRRIFQGQRLLAEEAARLATPVAFGPGQEVIQQGAHDNSVYMILDGQLGIVINDREVALRGPGQHVGEMALVNPAAPRSATVLSRGLSLLARISEPDFTALADKYPAVWRVIAIELSERLRQRSRFLRPKNPTPIVFLGSSKESLHLANALKDQLVSPELEVHLWAEDVFSPSHFPIEDLVAQLSLADFAAILLSADDITASRGTILEAPRDNTVFELGLFMGAISRDRTFLICPSAYDLKIPSDLMGLTTMRYSPDKDPSESAGMTALSDTIKQIVTTMGSL